MRVWGIKSFPLLLYFAILFAVLSSAAQGAVYYVDQVTGSDLNGGALTTPFKTINKGVKGLVAGDTLYVRAGIYVESLWNMIPSGSSWNMPVTVSAYPDEIVTLQPPIGANRVLHFDGVRTQFISIEGFILDGANVKYDVVKITYSGTELNHAHHIRIKNCEVKNSVSGQGILSTGGGNAGNNEFIGLDVHNNGNSEFDHGLYISSSSNIVEKCSVHNNFGYGIHLYGDPGNINNNIVIRNRVYDNGSHTDKAGIIVSAGNGNMIHHNLVYGHKYGIRVDYNVTNTKVYNNTVYGRDFLTGGIIVGRTSTGADVQNNLVYQTYRGNEIDDYGIGTALSNNLEGVEPKWVNPSIADFHLQSGSPAIGIGINCGLTTDFDNYPIPVEHCAIGAYEYHPVPAAPTNMRVL